MLLAEPRTESVSSTGIWHVAQTHGRYENRLARDLDLAGVDYFLPLTNSRRRNDRGRSYVVRESRPLFPCYLFVNTPDQYVPDAVRRSIATVKVINVVRQDVLAAQLESLKTAMENGLELGEPEELWQGQRVEIISGPMLGKFGKVKENTCGGCRVALDVDFLGRSVPIEIPIDQCEPC